MLAFRNKDGGLRPIEKQWVSRCADLFPRLQTGGLQSVPYRFFFQCSWGWGLREVQNVLSLPQNVLYLRHALVKLDYLNAFNLIRRVAIFEAVLMQFPDLLPYVLSSYKVSTKLHFGEFTIASSEGVQRGDPMGPLLFSFAF